MKLLSNHEIHIWVASIPQLGGHKLHFESLLTQPERERALTYRFERDQTRFVVRRGLLRALLGHYLNMNPANLTFLTTPQGQPFLADNPLNFNLSHSGDYAVFALTQRRTLGVDVEAIKPLPDFDQIAAKFFSPQEQNLLQGTSDVDKAAQFYRIWTCKEAFVKAIGMGLPFGLDQFSVGFADDGTAALDHIQDSAMRAADWSLQLFEPAPNYQAAVACKNERQPIQLIQHDAASLFA